MAYESPCITYCAEYAKKGTWPILSNLANFLRNLAVTLGPPPAGTLNILFSADFNQFYPLLPSGIISVSVPGANLLNNTQQFQVDEFRRVYPVDAF